MPAFEFAPAGPPDARSEPRPSIPSVRIAPESRMSIALPFLALLLVGAVAAYHRLRLTVWLAATLSALVLCVLAGANVA